MFKRILPILLMFPFSVWGQGSLIFFTENGERFTLTVNGQTINYQPDTRVRFDGVNTEGVKVNIKFEQAELGSVVKTVLASPALEVTYNLKRNKKNEWVIRYLSEAPAGTTMPSAPVAQPTYREEPVVPVQQSSPANTNPNNGSVGFQFNVSEQHGSVGIQMNVDGIQTNTTISGSHTLNSNIDHEHETWQSSQGEGNGQTRYEMATASQKCIVGMWDTELRKGIQTIQSHTSDEERLASAKQMADSYCFYIGQVKQVINLFTYDETKLAFAIYAYSKVASTDVKEYYTLSSLFTYGGTKAQFDEFLKSAKK